GIFSGNTLRQFCIAAFNGVHPSLIVGVALCQQNNESHTGEERAQHFEDSHVYYLLRSDSISRPAFKVERAKVGLCQARPFTERFGSRRRRCNSSVASRWQRRHSVRRFSRSHSPPPSLTGRM